MDFTKFTNLLSDIKLQNSNAIKYDLISVDEKFIYVIDRENNYKIYSIEYIMDSENNPLINWSTKTEGDITYRDKLNENEDSYLTKMYNEINDMLNIKHKSEYDSILEEKIKEYTENFNEKYSNLEIKFNELKNLYEIAKSELNQYKAIEIETEKQKHINIVKETLERFEKKIGKHPEFLYYKAKMDKYENIDLDKLEKDLTLLSGDIFMDIDKNKNNFSYNPVSTNVNNIKKYGTENDVVNRYGHLFDGFID